MTGHEDSKNSSASRNLRKSKYNTEPRVTRNKDSKSKKQNEYDDEDSDVDIPNKYANYFDIFKEFIDDYHDDHPVKKIPAKVTNKAMVNIKVSSKASNRDSEMNKSYASDAQMNHIQEIDNQGSSNYAQNVTAQNTQNIVQSQPPPVAQTNEDHFMSNHVQSQQNNQELLMQLLQAQATTNQISQSSNQNSVGKYTDLSEIPNQIFC
jgi:hypothetical protein